MAASAFPSATEGFHSVAITAVPCSCLTPWHRSRTAGPRHVAGRDTGGPFEAKLDQPAGTASRPSQEQGPAAAPSFISGRSLSELPRAALASQTHQQGEQTDRGSRNIPKSLEGFADSSCPKKSRDAATCSHSLKPGPESDSWQRNLRLQWGRGGGSCQKNLTPLPSSSVMISALCSCCKACRARSSIASSKP